MNLPGNVTVKQTSTAIVVCANGEIEDIGDLQDDWTKKPWRVLAFNFRQWARRTLGWNFGHGNDKRSNV